jgi:hypothetical protein
MMTVVNVRQLALLAWAAVNFSLVVMIGGELGWGKKLVDPMPVPVVHPAVPVKVVLPPDFRLPPLEKAYAGTLERSLFVPSRRKAPPPPPVTPTMQKGQFQLLGTTITDEFSIAIVKEISSGKVRQVYQGFTINGLQLELVAPDRIVFSQYDDHEEIRLKIQASPKPAAPPQAASQGEQPGTPQAAPAAQTRPAAAFGAVRAPAASEGRVERRRPTEQPPLPQSIEERKNDPRFKDFYK